MDEDRKTNGDLAAALKRVEAERDELANKVKLATKSLEKYFGNLGVTTIAIVREALSILGGGKP